MSVLSEVPELHVILSGPTHHVRLRQPYYDVLLSLPADAAGRCEEIQTNPRPGPGRGLLLIHVSICPSA